MLKPIIISYKLTTCQLLYLTNTYKPREILLTINASVKLIRFRTSTFFICPVRNLDQTFVWFTSLFFVYYMFLKGIPFSKVLFCWQKKKFVDKMIDFWLSKNCNVSSIVKSPLWLLSLWKKIIGENRTSLFFKWSKKYPAGVAWR